jgi:hypothetical protein
MAETKPFDQLSEAEIRKQLDKVAAEAAKTSAPAIATFAKFQEERASRLQRGVKQIKKDLGEGHPDYVATRAAAETAAAMNMQFLSHSARIKNRTVPRSYEWMVFGQVLDASGNPALGLTVRVFDRDRRFDDLLGETETDANGDFSVTYHERDFKEAGEKLPELYVLVSDARGTELYTTRDDVRFRAGRSEYFLIRLGKTARTAKPKSKQRKASSRGK